MSTRAELEEKIVKYEMWLTSTYIYIAQLDGVPLLPGKETLYLILHAREQRLINQLNYWRTKLRSLPKAPYPPIGDKFEAAFPTPRIAVGWFSPSQ